MQCGGDDGDARTAVRDDARHSWVGPTGVRGIGRHRNHPGVLAREERRDVIEPRRQQQHDAIARRCRVRDVPRHAGGAMPKLSVAEGALLLPGRGQEPVGSVRSVTLGPKLQHVHQGTAACLLRVVLQQGIQGRSSGISATTAAAAAFRRSHPASRYQR